jgi:hypothetical protein
MLQRHKPLILITIMLIVAALACSIGGRRQVELGETFQSDAGGYILQKVPDYDFEEYFGMVSMTAHDVDPDIGPYIIAYGELLDEESTSQKILDDMKITAEGLVFGSEDKTTIDGIEGLLVDFSGVEAGTDVQGKVFVATPRPLQEFYIIAMAPEEEWKDLEPTFDAVLQSVRFIDVQPFAFGFQETEPITDEGWEPPVDVPLDESPYLGELYHHSQGGFSFRKILGYDFVEDNDTIIMTKQNPSSNAGPEFMVIYQSLPVSQTNEELFDNPFGTGSDYHSPTPYVVDDIEGRLFLYDSTKDGEQVKGQVFLVMLSPYVYFNANVFAPSSEWAEVHPILEAFLASIDFSSEPTSAGPGQVIRQWATYAEASSQYSSTDYSAMQATGAPDVDDCEENPWAWAAESGDTEEYLVLYYETPINPTELTIFQSHNPSQVVEIQFIDTDGETWMLWYGDPHQSEFCPDVWTHTIELDEVFYTDTVVIWVDQSILGLGWVEIDAVELVGYPMGVTSEQEEPSQPAQPPVGDIPTNYTGLMAGPVYQGWISIILGETMETDLDRILTVDHIGTDTWPFRDDHKISYRYQLPWDGMTALISVTEKGWVYRMRVTPDAHPDDFSLGTVNRANYDELKAIYNRDKAIPYAVMANILESPGFLRETFIGEEDGVIRTIYNWYNADGDRITGTFLDGVLTGAIGLNYISAP